MDLMIDVETLATDASAKLLSVGACLFHFNHSVPAEELFKHTFYTNVGEYDVGMPFTESARTIEWWSKQSDAANQALAANRQAPKAACINFAVWCAEMFKAFGKGTVWANPPQFDLAILRTHFAFFGIECPWHWAAERDFRTLREIIRQKNGFVAPEVVSYSAQGKTIMLEKHNALHDAISQASKVQKIIQHMTGKTR